MSIDGGHISADGGQRQNQPGILCGLGPVQPLVFIDILPDIRSNTFVIVVRNCPSASGKSYGHPFATDGAKAGHSHLLQIIPRCLIDGFPPGTGRSRRTVFGGERALTLLRRGFYG